MNMWVFRVKKLQVGKKVTIPNIDKISELGVPVTVYYDVGDTALIMINLDNKVDDKRVSDILKAKGLTIESIASYLGADSYEEWRI